MPTGAEKHLKDLLTLHGHIGHKLSINRYKQTCKGKVQ